MADGARRPGADLSGPQGAVPGAAPEATGFFELLRRLEGPGRRWGRAGGPGREPGRLGQGVRLAAATRDVARVEARGDGGRGGPLHIEVEVIGLLGPEGPMPLHLTRWVFDRVSERWFEEGGDRATADTAFLDFCNLLQHRLIALYWRAWGDAQPHHQAAREGGGRVGATLAALAGIGLPGQAAALDPEVAAVALAHAPQVAHQVHGPERLTAPLAALLGAPVRLIEFVGSWTAIPAPLQTRLGRAHARLGQGAVVGERVFSRQDRAELRVGPLGLAAFRRLADDGPLRGRLRRLALHLMGRELELDLRLVLAAPEVPDPVLGTVALGRTGWLPGGRGRDRDDLRLSAVTRSAA